MSTNNETSKSSINYHLIVEAILFVIILFLLVNYTPSIQVDSQGRVENSVQSINLLRNGTLIVSRSGGKVIRTFDPIDNPAEEDSIKRIRTISIVATGTDKERASTKGKISFFDGLLSPAMADEHNNRDHVYQQITTYIDGGYICERYNITLNWKYVGGCL